MCADCFFKMCFQSTHMLGMYIGTSMCSVMTPCHRCVSSVICVCVCVCVCKQCVSRCGHRIVCIGSLFSRRDVFGMAQTRHHEVACVAFRQCFEAPLCQDQCRHRQHCWRALLFVAQRCSSSQALWARKPVAFMTTYSSPS